MYVDVKIKHEFVDVNGTRLYCEIAASGPTVVLIHGFTLDRRIMSTN